MDSDYGSRLYHDFLNEADNGKLPVVVPIRENVCYYRSFRAASYSLVYSEDANERLDCILTCCMYAESEAREGGHRETHGPEA
jgi:hypothetical protein